MRAAAVRASMLAFGACHLLAAQTRDLRIEPIDPAARRSFDKQVKVALVVGISDYPRGSGLSSLKYAARDADVLKAALDSQGYLVRKLVNSDATRSMIRRTLKELSEAVSADEGTFLFFFGGHGFTYKGTNYLATFGVTADDLDGEGLPVKDVEELLRSSKARRKLLFIDACRNDPTQGARAVGSRSFDKLQAAEGLRVLFSTKEGHVSFEDDALQQGIFTYFLVKGLQGDAAGADGLVTFRDLADYLTDKMLAYTVGSQVQIPFEAGESSGDFLLSSGTKNGRSPTTAPPARPLETVAPPEPISVNRAPALKANPKDGLTYVWIPPGTFTMGCSPGDGECFENEKPAHRVVITRGFWIGQTTVPQEQYEQVTKRNPSDSKSATMPVERVSFLDAEAYCRAVGMRLPTEAEWEYSARGGDESGRYGALGDIAWYAGNSLSKTHEGGLKQPNRFGLYDMLGNVSEWVADWYGDYSSASQNDPKGPSAGTSRTLRGGSYYDGPRNIRVSYRSKLGPGSRASSIGFRCVGE